MCDDMTSERAKARESACEREEIERVKERERETVIPQER